MSQESRPTFVGNRSPAGRLQVDQTDIRRRTGLRIRVLRMERGMTQEGLANSIGMSQSYLAEVEGGKRNVSMENVARIAGGLGVSVREMFDDEAFE